jgi:Nucleotidyltransferase of unknown function (DUF6036)
VSTASVLEVFRAVASAAACAPFRWYLFGAQAVLAYGAPRLTADVDVTIEPGKLEPRDILRWLKDADIRARDESFVEALERSRLLPLVHAPSGIAVDVVLASGGIEQDFLARARLLDIGGVSVPVLSVEDLIATKVVAGRRKDREDVLGILREQGARVDRDQLRAVLELFDQSLDEPRAVRAFERLERASRRLR